MDLLMRSSTNHGGRIKIYIPALLAALIFWLLSAGLQGAFSAPTAFSSYLVPRMAGELWLRVLLSIFVAFAVINLLDREESDA